MKPAFVFPGQEGKEPPQLTPEEKKKKQQLEKLLKKRGYHRDDRPDHREWTKVTSSFHYKIRLDQNNPDGWNGFQALITTYMRWDVRKEHLDALLKFLKEEFGYEIS